MYVGVHVSRLAVCVMSFTILGSKWQRGLTEELPGNAHSEGSHSQPPDLIDIILVPDCSWH